MKYPRCKKCNLPLTPREANEGVDYCDPCCVKFYMQETLFAPGSLQKDRVMDHIAGIEYLREIK